MLFEELPDAALDPQVGLLLERVVGLVDVDPSYGEDDFFGGDVEGCPALLTGWEHAVVGFDEPWSHGPTLPH